MNATLKTSPIGPNAGSDDPGGRGGSAAGRARASNEGAAGRSPRRGRAGAARDVLGAAASVALFALAGASCTGRKADPAPLRSLRPVASNELRAVADFAAVADKEDRSRALFLEASRVLLHPRCANCHPNGDVPLQGMEMAAHQPPVTRGPENKGVVGMECAGCHQDHNVEHARVPGAPNWHVAPREMAWVGQSPRRVCEQMKDPKRNGGKTLAQIVEHNAHDELVGWGWAPGRGREPAPGTQEQFGALVAAWVETGAACPAEEERP